MRQPIPFVAVIGAMLVSAGCEERPSIVTLVEVPAFVAPAPSPSPSLPYVDPGFPAAPPGSTVYGRISPSQGPGSQRYVLHESGRFGLQYFKPQWGFFEYAGSYSRSGSIVSFSFDANRPEWTAIASVDGASMAVTYNAMMILDDFENGVYVRTSGGGS